MVVTIDKQMFVSSFSLLADGRWWGCWCELTVQWQTLISSNPRPSISHPPTQPGPSVSTHQGSVRQPTSDPIEPWWPTHQSQSKSQWSCFTFIRLIVFILTSPTLLTKCSHRWSHFFPWPTLLLFYPCFTFIKFQQHIHSYLISLISCPFVFPSIEVIQGLRAVPALNLSLYIVVVYCLYFPQTLSIQIPPQANCCLGISNHSLWIDPDISTYSPLPPPLLPLISTQLGYSCPALKARTPPGVVIYRPSWQDSR